jgi:hypothetical protein
MFFGFTPTTLGGPAALSDLRRSSSTYLAIGPASLSSPSAVKGLRFSSPIRHIFEPAVLSGPAALIVLRCTSFPRFVFKQVALSRPKAANGLCCSSSSCLVLGLAILSFPEAADGPRCILSTRFVFKPAILSHLALAMTSTAQGRYRFTQPSMTRKYAGVANALMSHIWADNWDVLVVAVVQSAFYDWFVWISWPGNASDIDFTNMADRRFSLELCLVSKLATLSGPAAVNGPRRSPLTCRVTVFVTFNGPVSACGPHCSLLSRFVFDLAAFSYQNAADCLCYCSPTCFAFDPATLCDSEALISLRCSSSTCLVCEPVSLSCPGAADVLCCSSSTCLVFARTNVWGDHAFFYKPQAAVVACHMAAKPVVEVPERCLAVRTDDMPDAVPFDDQRYFNLDEIIHYFFWAKSRHRTDKALAADLSPRLYTVAEIEAWKGHWWTHDIKTAARLLSERHVSFYPKYVSPHKFTRLRVVAERKRITISQIPDEYQKLRAFCLEFQKLTGLELPYHGESIAAVGNQAFRALFVNRRPHCDRSAIAGAQQWKCNGCGEKLSDFEVHHKQPVVLGGTSDLSNLEALCRACHAVETDRLLQAGALSYQGFASQLSPRMTEMFLATPKPKQWHFGEGVDHNVSCLDVRGCRRNALVHSRRPLPVFGPADEPEVFVGLRPELDAYDYLWVKREGPPLDDIDSVVYDGEHLYPWCSVDYMLDWGIIKIADVK